MELTKDAISILTPLEMRTIRKQGASWTLETLAVRSGISIAQLSEYENGRNGLRRDQVEKCEWLLLDAARERSQTIAKLLGPDGDAVAGDMMVTS